MPFDANPSNRLYHNQVHDFVEATNLFEKAINNELALGYAIVDGSMGFFQAELDKAKQARGIYLRLIGRGESRDAVITELRGFGLNEWADALSCGDYSKMAV